MWNPTAAPPDRPPQSAAWIGAAALFAAMIVLAGIHPIIVDDTFITFQYARNLVEHGVLTWWPDAPMVDGFTSLGHALLLALLHGTGLNLVAANSLLNGAAMALVVAGVMRMTHELRPSARILGLSVVLLNAGFVFWLSGGLDGILYAAAVLWTYVLYEPAHRRARFGPAMAAVLIALIVLRPEGQIITCAVILLFWVTQVVRGRLKFRTGVMWPLVPVVAVLLLTGWRMWIYGHPLPNTYYAKSSFYWLDDVREGLSYVAQWTGSLGGFILLATPAALLLGSGAWLRTGFIAGIIAIVILAGGDPQPRGRFLLAILPLIAIDMAWAFNQNHKRFTALLLPVTAGYLIIQLALIVSALDRPASVESSLRAIAKGQWPYRSYRDNRYLALQVVMVQDMNQSLAPGLPMIGTDVGLLGFVSDRWIRDAVGLNDPELAHLPKPAGIRNNWGITQLEPLIQEQVPLAYIAFPTYDDWSWQELASGERSCNPRAFQRVSRLSDHTALFGAQYLCASIPASDNPGLYMNLFVHRGSGRNAFTDPDRVKLSQCMPAVFTACGIPAHAASE